MTPTAAVAVIECQGVALLIRRSQRLGDPWAGQWALPGGKRDPLDSDLLATARRELQEEVGLHLADDGWTALGHQTAGLHHGPGVVVAPFHRKILTMPQLIPDQREVAATCWLALSEFCKPNRHEFGRISGGGEREWPFFRLEGVPLWGFTYRVLRSAYIDMTQG